MTPTQRLWLNALIVGFITMTATVIGALAVQSWRAAVVAVIIIIGLIIAGGILWWFSLRPRLFFYNAIIVHWPVWIALALLTGAISWLYFYVNGERLIGASGDAILIALALVFGTTLLSRRLPELLRSLITKPVPEEQVAISMSYVGKIGDQVGRGSIYCDGYQDATFSLTITPKSRFLWKTVTFILLQRVDIRRLPRSQQWITNQSRIYWPLGVCDTSGIRLNPVGAPVSILVNQETSLQLFASDWADIGSDWFSTGQRYLATVYFSDGTWAEALPIIS